MKFIVLMVFISLGVRAQTANDCATQVLKIPDWSKLAPPVLDCLNANADFTFGISILCESDRVQLSMPFEQYLKYQKDYQDALEAYQTTLNPSEVLRLKLIEAKEAWDTLGNQAQLGPVLNKVRTRYLICSDHN